MQQVLWRRFNLTTFFVCFVHFNISLLGNCFEFIFNFVLCLFRGKIFRKTWFIILVCYLRGLVV